MKHRLFFTIWMALITAVFLNTPARSQTVQRTIESYHISPTFTYKSIQLFPQSHDGSINILGTPCEYNEAGTIFNSDNMTDEIMSVLLCQINEEDDPAQQGFWAPLPGLWSQSGNNIFLTNVQNPEDIRILIGDTPLRTFGDPINVPHHKLTLSGSGIIASGTEFLPLEQDLSQFSDIPAGDYAMFLWYPQKGAFRAQRTGTDAFLWNEDNVGYYSAAFGYNTIASGFGAFAGGENNTVIGPLSMIAGGKNNYVQTLTDPLNESSFLHRFINNSSIIGGENNYIGGQIINDRPSAGPAGNLIGGGKNNFIVNASESAILGGSGLRIHGLGHLFPDDEDPKETLPETPTDTSDATDPFRIMRTSALILGGSNSSILDSKGAAIAMGENNSISSTFPNVNFPNPYQQSLRAGIFNGRDNQVSDGYYSLIGSGLNNIINSSDYSTIAAGENNTIFDSSGALILGGGPSDSSQRNSIQNAPFSIIAGGRDSLKIEGSHNILIGGFGPSTGGFTMLSGHHSFLNLRPISTSLESSLFNSAGNYSVNTGARNHGNYSIARPVSRIFSGDFSSTHGFSHSYGNFSWTGTGKSGFWSTNKGERIFYWGVMSYMDQSTQSSSCNNCIDENASDLFIIANQDAVEYGLSPFKVGIGTLDPQYTLDVAGKIRTASLSIGTINNADVSDSELWLGDHSEGGKELSIRPPDLAEIFKTTHPVLPGDVLVIDPDNAHLLSKSNNPYASNAIGVVSSAPAMVFTGNGLITTPETSTQPTTHPAVALTGRIPVKVSMENGPIEPGDLLTTSSQPGIAMKATDIQRSEHAVIGKALQTFDNASPEETGIILAIIMIR